MTLIFLIIVAVYILGKCVYDDCTKNTHAFSKEELNQMNLSMVGKSQKECRKIIREYSKQERD